MRLLKLFGFIDYKREYFKDCIVCNKILTGRQRFVCSRNCHYKYNSSPNSFDKNANKIKRLTRVQFQERNKLSKIKTIQDDKQTNN